MIRKLSAKLCYQLALSMTVIGVAAQPAWAALTEGTYVDSAPEVPSELVDPNSSFQPIHFYGTTSGSPSTTGVPEPASAALAAGAMLGFYSLTKRRRPREQA